MSQESEINLNIEKKPRIVEKVDKASNASKFYHTTNLALVISFITVLILVIYLGQLSQKKPIVLLVDSNKIPVPAQTLNEDFRNFINRKAYVSYLLYTLYNWSYDNYKIQLKYGLPLLAEDIRKQYINQFIKNSSAEQIANNKIESGIRIVNIDDSSGVRYKEGFQIKVQAIRIRLADFIKRETMVEFTIAFRTCPFSQDNFWGLEVFEIEEKKIGDRVNNENEEP